MERFHSTSRNSSVDLNEAVLLLKSQENYIAKLRDRFDHFGFLINVAEIDYENFGISANTLVIFIKMTSMYV